MAPTSPPESRLIFILQVLFVAIILFVFVLFIRQYQVAPSIPTTSRQTSTTIATVPKPSVAQTTPPASPPKNVPIRSIVHMQLTRSAQPSIKAVGVLAQWQNRCFLLCSAELLAQSDWSQLTRTQLLNGATVWLTLPGPPKFIGSHTQDRQPNMFTNPDLAEGLVAWPLEEKQLANSIKLADHHYAPGTHLWLLTPTAELKRCKVVHCDDKQLIVEPIDRFNMEDFPGCPLIDAESNLAGIHLGCTIVVITGPSAVGIRNKLQAWNR